jgi:hypothetical protein
MNAHFSFSAFSVGDFEDTPSLWRRLVALLRAFENFGNTRSITCCIYLRGLLLALSDLILAF